VSSLPSNQYVEVRDGQHYYVAGTRIGLDVIAHAYRRGKTPEAIFEAFPSIESLGKVYGAIAFMLDYPEAVEQYLRAQEIRWEKFRQEHPLPEDVLDRFRRVEKELSRRTA
jgi:uncharacterized protein (DUF433 family)